MLRFVSPVEGVAEKTLSRRDLMAPKPDETDEIETEELPDDEDQFLEELGMAADGSRMQPSDDAWNGRPWDPDGKHLE